MADTTKNELSRALKHQLLTKRLTISRSEILQMNVILTDRLSIIIFTIYMSCWSGLSKKRRQGLFRAADAGTSGLC